MRYKTFEEFFLDAVRKRIIKVGLTTSAKNSIQQGFKVYFDTWLGMKFGREATKSKTYLNYLTFENLLLHERWQVERRIADDLKDNLEYETSQKLITKLGHPFFAYIETYGITGEELDLFFDTDYGKESDKEKFLREMELMNKQRLARAKLRISSQPNLEYVISKHEYLSEWIKRKQAELNTVVGGKKSIGKKDPKKPTYVLYALYYFYLQKAGIKEYFHLHEGGITDGYKSACQEGKYDAPTSWAKFRNEYLKIHRSAATRLETLKPRKRKLLELLEQYPKAIEKVNKELEQTAR